MECCEDGILGPRQMEVVHRHLLAIMRLFFYASLIEAECDLWHWLRSDFCARLKSPLRNEDGGGAPSGGDAVGSERYRRFEELPEARDGTHVLV